MAMKRSGLSWAIVALLATGCGSGSPYDYVKVQGKLTYEDDSAIPFEGETRIVFESQAEAISENTHPRPAVAYVSPDGTFSSATSAKYGDGLVRGRHKVLVSATDASGKLLIPPEYSDVKTTPLEVDTADSPFHMKIRKPTKEESKPRK